MSTDTSTEEFVKALGVEVVEVDSGGRCFVWHEAEKKVCVCQNLCPTKRERGFNQVVGRLEVV